MGGAKAQYMASRHPPANSAPLRMEARRGAIHSQGDCWETELRREVAGW